MKSFPTIQGRPVQNEKTLKGDGYVCKVDLHITGKVTLKGKLVVGGNLTADGDLKAAGIYCLGKILVNGNIKTEAIVSRGFIETAGDLFADFIKTGCELEEIAALAGIEDTEDLIHDDIHDPKQFYARPANWRNRLAESDEGANDSDEEVMAEEEFDAWDRWDSEDPNITVAKNLICKTISAASCVDVTGKFEAEVAELSSLSASHIHISGRLFSSTGIELEGKCIVGRIDCPGRLIADEIDCPGGIFSGESIFSSGNIISGKSIETGQWIAAEGKIHSGDYIIAGECIVAERGISAGRDFGILAGRAMPRSKWQKFGFVYSPMEPKNILTGTYVADQRSAMRLMFEDTKLRVFGSFRNSGWRNVKEKLKKIKTLGVPHGERVRSS